MMAAGGSSSNPMSSEASSSAAAAAAGVAVRDVGDDKPLPSAEVDITYWAAQEEAAALLESMAARARGEDDLPEEQLQANNQLQEDEVIALQAIFGDDMVILENKDNLRFIQIFVHYTLPDSIRVFLNLRRSGAMVGTDDSENHNGGELYLLAAKWLDEPKVSYLCAALDEVWTELPGQEVIYRWVDWLNSSSWSSIALNDEIVLDPDKTLKIGDERAIARRILVESTIPLMQSYSEKRSHKIFLESLLVCGICLSEDVGRNFIKLPCHHSFCLKCVESHCKIHVKEGNLTQLACPDTNCRNPLPPSVLKSLLRDDGYAQWESFALQKLLDAMPDLVYCPRCSAACLEVDNDAQCPGCFFTFCTLCKRRRHVGDTCITPEEKIRILKDCFKLIERQKLYSIPEEQLLKEQREIDELINIQEALRDSKQCPRCKMAISKIEGCNKMTCGNCGRFFCYRCNKAIGGYDHFWNGNCDMFEREQDENPQQQDDENFDGDPDEDAELLEPEWVLLTYPCPNCGRRNEKANLTSTLVPPLFAVPSDYDFMDTSEDEGQVSSGSPSPISLNIKASEQSIPWEIPMSSEASSSSSAAVAVRDLGDDNPSASPEVDTTYWAAQEEATALLESMAARVRGEEELSEEQMQANDQLQEDEVIALEAIFGGDMVILENKDSLRFIQIFVHYSLPDGIRVFLNLRRSGALVGTGDNENHNGGEIAAFTTCCADMFVATVISKAPRARSHIQMVDWLNSSSWSFIALNDEIVLSPDRTSKFGDERAIARRILVESTIPLMQIYSEKRSHKSTAPGVMLLACKLTMMLNVRTVFLPSALCANNAAMWGTHERQKLHSMSAEQLLKERRELEELMNIQEALRSSKQCPHCKMAISKIEGCNKMICVNCGGYFCYRCNQAIKGYEHFWGGNCVLFGTHAHYQIRNPQQQRDENPGDHAELLEQRVQLTYPCPNCGSRNEKYPKLELSYSNEGQVSSGSLVAAVEITMMTPGSSSTSVPGDEAEAGNWDAGVETAARLEAMVHAEDELSEEQIQANNQTQEDELLALQAIYGDDLVIFNNKDGLRFFQISLHYQLAGDIRVYLNVCPNGRTETGAENDDDDDSDRLLYACSLQHLPPVVLTCLLPRLYPSHRAPYFVVAAKWLDEPEVSSFCSVLDEIWAEQPAGQEVVYKWVDWLSTSSWSCIASDDQIVFGPDADSAGGDDRAIGRSCSLDSMIPLIQRYSKERSHEIFARRIHECGVCLSENTGRNFIQLPCSHSFCVKCMETQCRIHVKEGSVARLTCPDTSCRRPLPPALLRGLLGDGEYARWESLVLRGCWTRCPTCSAACVAAGDDAQCSRCFFTFCAVCRERRHVGDTCVSPNQMLDIMLERQKEKRPLAAPSPDSQAVSEKRKMEELLSLREVMRTSRQCPSCKMAVSKTAGCNKMVCSNCGRPFCYRCSRAITGYKHFAGECKLFESVGKGWFPGQAMWMNLEYDYDEIAEIGTPSWIRAIRYPCPTCGAKRTKSGNNDLLTCRGCRTHYCALCSKKVWSIAEHYGPAE
uniref:RBR-type E3 ubiquitin transferase n=1 Tax=Oryza nivara TaxID=4536 RepID=A0A0E0GBK6_ORYNI